MKLLTEKDCENFVNLAVERTAEYLRENNLKGITLGISGGIDSAIVSVIGLKAVEKLKEEGLVLTVDYVFLDCDSDPVDLERAKEHAKVFGYKLRYLDLSDWYAASPLLKSIPEDHPRANIARGNIKCRLRMISLYHSAQLNSGICLDTDDLSEEYMGFWTKHGDEGDVKIVQQVTKTELYDIGEYLGVPEIILKSKPGDGLKVSEGNVASDQLGLEYIYIEYIMNRMLMEGFDPNGTFDQLDDVKIKKTTMDIAEKTEKSENSIEKVLKQSLKTAFKRKYGDPVKHLLPSREEFGFLKFDSSEFAERQLAAIKDLDTK